MIHKLADRLRGRNKPAKEGYRTAFKATSLFGGVQVVTVLTGLLKSKLVAVWMGTTGFGILSLYNAAVNLIFSISNLGLQSSAVRDIAAASADKGKTLAIIKAVNRWVLASGLLGALLTVALSPRLSRWLFESDQYVGAFVLLSAAVLLMGLFNQNYAVLQGLRKLRLMARANIFGALAGFVCSVPVFYFFREQGLAWTVVISALASAVVSLLYVRKLGLVLPKQDWHTSMVLGSDTVKLGIVMAISSIAVFMVQFVVKTYISHRGGLGDVGLYQAGWGLNEQYLGLVFTAMAKDYFPRLSQVAGDHRKVRKSINEQAEIAILILAPMIIAMLVFLPFVVRLLYSGDFDGIVPMTRWLLLGSLLKAGSWAISFVFLAKGHGKTYLFNELGIKFFTLPTYMLGYRLLGLLGVGYAYVLCYGIYFLWVGIVAYRKYRLMYSGVFWKMLAFTTTLLAAYLLMEPLMISGGLHYWLGIPLIVLLSIYSLRELKKRLF